MTDTSDMADKMSGFVSTIDPPEVWENVLGLPTDYYPSFGWNVKSWSEYGLGIGLALQCASVKARDIAKSGMMLWRKTRQPEMGIVWEELLPNEHWFARMLARKPNDFMSWGDFWRLVILHLELAQDCYILVVRDGLDQVRELIPLPPARVTKMVAPNGELFYEIHAGNELERARVRADYVRVPARAMIHIMGRSMDGITGISNIVLGGQIFDLIGAIQAYQKDLFHNRGRPPVSFETSETFEDTTSGETAFRRLKEQLTDRWKKGLPLLLEAGLQAKVLAQTSRENLTTEAYNAQVNRICTLMMVPPHKIFAYENVKYDNAAHADNQYGSECLEPIADNIEEKLRNGLLDDADIDILWPEFDRKRMIASDPKSVNERVKIGMMYGLLTINDGRGEFGYNPCKGGNRRLQPVAMAQVDEDGNLIPGQTGAEGQPANAPAPGEDDDAANAEGERRLRLVRNG